MSADIPARPITPGMVDGPLLLLEPLSLWGGVDLADGRIVDATHPQLGTVIANRIIAMRSARGSSSSSSALVELARLGLAPAAILLGRHDPILTIGAIVAADLYGKALPLAIVGEADWLRLTDGALVTVEVGEADAVVRLTD